MVSIIILSYNTKELLLSCLRSINKYLSKSDIEIIIIDNASTDGTKEIIQSSKFKIIENKENLGFAKANDIGAKEAKGEYLLFLNSDTQLLNGKIIEMADFLKNNKSIGIIGGKLLNEDNSPQLSCGRFYGILEVMLMLFGAEKLIRKSPDNITRVNWVSGACLMIKKDLFEKVGGFDESFFMYMEDMELCYCVNKLGYQIWFYPAAKILHIGHGSSDRSFAIVNIYQSLLYFHKKHKSKVEYELVKMMLFVKAYLAIITGIISNNSYLRNTYKKAIQF